MDALTWGRSTPDFGWPETQDHLGGGGHSHGGATSSGFPGNYAMMGSSGDTGSGGQNGWFANYWQPRYPSLNYPPGPGSGLSRQSSLDDLTSMETDQVFDYEDRFRVDRRKLENLILGRFEPIKESAPDFFLRIGSETGATVIWPSRLKVGAKSKKDPHIRVGGSEEGVILAKTIILEHLDTKTRRVTMKMDVSYTDHSHIIGKGGNTIRRVMSETGCHIHFPDSNRSNPNEKSNQVSIAGEMEGVEKARARVRELTPLIFTFDLPIVPSVELSLDPNDPYLRAIQDQYNIQLMFRQKQKNFHTTMAVIKGCEWEAGRVKEATLMLIDHLCGTSGNITPTTPVSGGSSSTDISQTSGAFPVTMNMEISPIHHSVVVGKNNINLRVIMQRTNTVILFPDAADPNIPPIRRGSVSITGTIHNVYAARQQLVGSLPLVMMFDMPDNTELIDSEVQKIGEDLDVAISIKPKHRQGSKSVLIKAQERSASSIYSARFRLIKADDFDEEVLVQAEIPETYKVQPIPAHLLQSLGGMNQKKTTGHHSPYVFPPNNHGFFGGAQSIPPPPPFNPYLMPAQTPWAGAAAAAAMSNVLPPNHPYLQDYALLVLNNITRLQQQQQQQQQLEQQQKKIASSANLAAKVSAVYDPNNNNGWFDALKNDRDRDVLKVDGLGGTGQNSPPIVSPRNSSPVQEGGNLTNNLSQLDLNATISDKMLQISLEDNDEGLGTTTSNTSSSNLSNYFFQDRRLDPHRRAPGCEKQVLQKQLDYDQKRLMATRAVQQSKPCANEPRTPTQTWSGLGFSNSMPENVIREKLAEEAAANKVKAAAGGALQGINEEQQPACNGDQAQNWFGNSSGALDALFHPPKHSGVQAAINNNPTILATDDLSTILSKYGLAKYTDLFLRHEVDLQTFATLTEQDLREIGVTTFGARKKLLLLANKVKQIQEW